MSFMLIVLTILIAIGVIAVIWRGFVREDRELTARPPVAEARSTGMRRDRLAMTEFGEDFEPAPEPDRRVPVNETSSVDLEDVPDEAEAQPLSASLQQMEQTEAVLQDTLLRDLQQQLADTASILEQVDQCLLTLQAIEPIQHDCQQLLTAAAADAIQAPGSSPLVRE